MPVPQRGNFLVGWVGDHLKNGQDARSTKSKFSCGVGILPARSTKSKFSCGVGILPAHERLILPAHERLIDKGSIFQFIPAYLDNLAVNFTEFDVSSHR